MKKERPELAHRKGVVFHHDNARPHTSLMTQNKLTELGWKVLTHPPCSPDLAPSDYHLFRALQNSLDGKKLADRDAAETHLYNINHYYYFIVWLNFILSIIYMMVTYLCPPLYLTMDKCYEFQLITVTLSLILNTYFCIKSFVFLIQKCRLFPRTTVRPKIINSLDFIVNIIQI